MLVTLPPLLPSGIAEQARDTYGNINTGFANMKELLDSIGALGLPGWTLIIIALIVVLHYTGILGGVGAFLSAVFSGNQKLMAELQSKALDQNGILIHFITDKMEADLEKLAEGDKEICDRLTRIETKLSFVTYELTERERDKRLNRNEGNFKLISQLQEELAILKGELGRIKNEPIEHNDNEGI